MVIMSIIDAYSFPYMKSKLENHFGNIIMISEIAGTPNVVTFKTIASAIIHEFLERSMIGDSISQ